MPKLNWPWQERSSDALLCIITILIALGVINVFSSSLVLAGQTMGDSFYFLKRHLLSILIGLPFLFLAIKTDYHLWKRYVPLMVLVTMVLLALVLHSGVVVNGARRWLRIGLQFQPSELAKLVVVIFTATSLAPIAKRGGRVSVFSLPLGIAALMAVLIYKQPDMGTAALIVALSGLLYIVAGLSLKEILPMAAICGLLAAQLSGNVSYRAERVAAWLNPWAYQEGSGYQTVQSLLAIGSGGWHGVGLGGGVSKFFYLPEVHTDFAFSVFCEEFGFLGAAFVLILFVGLTWHGIKIALAAPDHYGLLLGVGLTSMISGQAIGNIAMVTNIIPVTGVPLPFISFGGTSLVINMIAVGILINIEHTVQRVRGEGNPAEDPTDEDALRQARIARWRAKRGLRAAKK